MNHRRVGGGDESPGLASRTGIPPAVAETSARLQAEVNIRDSGDRPFIQALMFSKPILKGARE